MIWVYGLVNMVRCMKTTVEIPDPVLEAARDIARREGTTVKALIEKGLRQVIDEHEAEPAFELRKASFRGQGLQPEFAGMSWQDIRNRSYEGRGF